jgi:hypothetical protein
MLRVGVKVLLTLFPMLRAMLPVLPVLPVSAEVDDTPAGLEHPKKARENAAIAADKK